MLKINKPENKRLFKAAPALLEACKLAVKANTNIETCDMPIWLEKAEQAIAQAETK